MEDKYSLHQPGIAAHLNLSDFGQQNMGEAVQNQFFLISSG